MNALIREKRKLDKNFPLKKDLDPKALAGIEKEFENYRKSHTERMHIFAKSFGLTLEDLIKMLNKQKTPE